MMEKIDKSLITKTKTLSQDKKVLCIIKAGNFGKVKNFLNKEKIEIIKEYSFIKSFFVELNCEEIKRISNLFSVDYISSVATASMLMKISRQILKTDKVKESGKGVTASIIDTGVAPHLDFCLGRKRIRKSVDFINHISEPYDDNGHGTFVCGAMAGSGAESAGKYAGIAPNADIISLKALDSNGEAYSNKILEAMEWIYDHHKKENIRVVCMSFGSEPLGYNDPIMIGAEELWKDGVVVVTAAGNSGPEHQTIKSPGVSSKIITVGGLDDNRFDGKYDENLFEIADFSSRGPAFNRYKPDVIAPAVDIKSCKNTGGYTVLSGTSVATPMIAGLACLILERFPRYTPDQVKYLLERIATPITFDKNLEGFGLPDISKILN